MRLGHVAALRGRDNDAIGHFQKELGFLQRVDHALRARISIELNMRLGASCLRLGRADEARAALGVGLSSFEQRVRLGADEPFTRYYAACIYALRGEKQEALSCLDKTIKMRKLFTVARARIEPEFESLRDEPRFQEMLSRA
jgi:tetratricopeptide (TPR) repeat protein